MKLSKFAVSIYKDWYLSIGEKFIFINEISVAGATASNVPEIIISTTQVLRNFARIPARKMS